MLDISFLKLAGGAKKQMLALKARFGVNERHYILQLIAEAEGAPRLVVSGSRPKPAGQRLI
jgi:hypothetical protein